MPSGLIKFDVFVLDFDRYELHRGGDNIRLEKMPMELLILLVGKEGKLVTREEIVDHIWGRDVFVDTEHGINTAIRKIRQALKDDPESPRFVQTVTGKGYRFIGQCKNSNGDAAVPVAAHSAIPRQGQPIKTARKSRAWIWLAIAAAAICLAVGTALALNLDGLRDHIFRGNQVGPIHSIAVLPLTNLSGDPSQDYFADGMTDEMITALARNHSLRVVSRTSAMQYKGVNKPLREIAQALGVDGILEGSVMRSNGKMHVNLQLIYAPADTHVWAESYDRSLNDAIALPEEVSQTIAARAKMPPPAVKPPRYISPEAHDAYLQGRFFWFMADNDRSEKNFARAAQLQPDYALAWDGLADTYTARTVSWEVPPSEAFAKAEEYARKALALDDSLPDGHNTLAAIHLFHDWDWPQAEAQARKCLELNPNFADGHEMLSNILFVENRDAEALQEQKIATQIDPLTRPSSLGLAYLYTRHIDAAIETLKQSSQYRREFWTQFNLSTAYQIKGDDLKSAEALEQAYRTINDTKDAAAVRQAFKKNGLRGVWQWSLGTQLARAKKQYVSPWVLAWQYAEIRDKEHALAKLEDAYQEHSAFLVLVEKQPIFEFVHSDPRYQELVRKMGLPPAN